MTILGIVFGVAAVIAMLAIGNGAREETIRMIEKFGATSITIKSIEMDPEQLKKALRKGSLGLSRKDAIYLKEICPFIKEITSQLKVNGKLRFEDQTPKVNLIGVEPNYFQMTNLSLSSGRPFFASDFTGMKKVTVLGSGLAKKLFGNGSPIGQMVIIGPYHFQVVGCIRDRKIEGTSVSGSKMAVSIKSRDINNDAYIPWPLAQFVLPRPNELKNHYNQVDEILVKIDDKDHMNDAKSVIKRVLNRRHYENEDFELIIPLEILQQSQKTLKIFNIVMVCIAGLSLLIGGIGIMNIMLANVSERTREIGIRRAIGATQNDILVQFLLESILISCFGGIIGIVLGKLLSSAVSLYAGWSTVVSIEAVLLSFGVSAMVGVIFGFFPARRAAFLNPIDALKAE